MVDRRKAAIWFVIVGLSVCGTGGYFMLRVVDFPLAAAGLEAARLRAEAVGVPLTQRDLLPDRPVPDDQNAAPLLRQAFRRIESIQDLRPAQEWASPDRRPSASATAAADAVLAQAEAGLRLSAEASRKPRLDWGWDFDEAILLELPQLSSVRTVARLLCTRAMRRADTGDPAGAVDDLASAKRLGELLAQQPMILTLLLKFAVDTMVSDAAVYVLSRHPNDTGARDRIRREVAVEPDAGELYRAMRGEAYFAVATARNLDRLGGARALSDPANLLPAKDTPIRREGMPEGTVARAYMRRALDYWAETLSAVREARTPEAVDALRQGPLRDPDWGITHGVSRMLLAIMVPVYGQLLDAVATRVARHRMLAVYLDVLQTRAPTGKVPAVVTLTGDEQRDPFDGRPLRYRAEGDKFWVWSVGRDRRDDGGVRGSEIRRQAVAAGQKAAEPRGDVVFAFPVPKR